MKVRIDYTTRTATPVETASVFQYSHNIDIIEIQVDRHVSGENYKLNITDASGNSTLSKFMVYAGSLGGLHYYRALLRRENTLYAGDITMTFSIHTVATIGGVSVLQKVWQSEAFYQTVSAGNDDSSVDLDNEEASAIEEIYNAINLKLSEAHKGNYFASELGLSGTMTTQAYVTAVLAALVDAEGDFVFSGVAHIANDAVTLSDSVASEVVMILSTNDKADSNKAYAFLYSAKIVAENKMYFGVYANGTFSGWNTAATAADLNAILNGTTPFTAGNFDGDADISGNAEIHGNFIVHGTSNMASLEMGDDGIDMDGAKVFDMADGTEPQDAATFKQVDAKLPKSGGTMSGAIAMGGNKVTGLANGSADSDAINVGQVAFSLAYKQDISEKDQANGYAGLNSSGKLANSVIPALAITERFVVASEAAQLALTAQQGDVAIRTDLNKSYIHNGGTAGTMGDWTELLTPTDLVLSVNGETGAVTIDAADIATDEVGQTVQDALDIQDGLTTDHEERLDIIEASQLTVSNIQGGNAETVNQSTKIVSIAKATEIANTAVAAITQINQDEALSRFSPPLTGTVTDSTEVTETAQGFHAHTYSLKGQTFVQLVKNGNFVNTGVWQVNSGTFTVANNEATITSTAAENNTGILQANVFVAGQVYLVKLDVKSATNSNLRLGDAAVATDFSLEANVWKTISILQTASGTSFRIYKVASASGQSFNVRNVQCINLIALGNIPGTSTAWTTLTASQVAAYLGNYKTTAQIVADAIAGGETTKISNGDFATDTVWTKGAGWTITGGQAVATTTTADLTHTFQPTVGRTYYVVHTSTVTGGTYAVKMGGVTGTTRDASGTYSMVMTATSTAALAVDGLTSFTGTIDNVSVYDITDYFATSGIHSFTTDTIEVTDGTDTRTLDVSTIGGLASLPSGARDLFENTIQPDGERLMQITKVAHRLALPYGQVGGVDKWQLKKVGTANTRFEMKIENFWTAYTPDMDATRCYRATLPTNSGWTFVDDNDNTSVFSYELGITGLEQYAENTVPTIIIENTYPLGSYDTVVEAFTPGVCLNGASTHVLLTVPYDVSDGDLGLLYTWLASNPVNVVIPYDGYGAALDDMYCYPHTPVTFNAHTADTAGLATYEDQDGNHFVSYKVANATADTLSELYTHLLANPITLVIPIVEAQFEHNISDYLIQYDESTFSVTSSTFVKPSYWSLTYIKDLNKVIAAILAAIA